MLVRSDGMLQKKIDAYIKTSGSSTTAAPMSVSINDGLSRPSTSRLSEVSWKETQCGSDSMFLWELAFMVIDAKWDFKRRV